MTASYNNQEFFRVGYYVNNYYEDQELNENPPSKPILEKLTRHILVEKPRLTKFQIEWEEDSIAMPTVNDENNPNMGNLQESQIPDGLMSKGTQEQDRQNMMSSANLAQVQQIFY